MGIHYEITFWAHLTYNAHISGPSVDEFFEEYLNAHPEAAEDVNKAKDALTQPTADADIKIPGFTFASRLIAGANEGRLKWRLDNLGGSNLVQTHGSGDCDKNGVAVCIGGRNGGASSTVGTYHLEITTVSCTLTL